MIHLEAQDALGDVCRSHFLTERADSIEPVATALVGLHATSPAGPYLSLRARVRDFRRPDLTTSMWERWQLVRFRAMRLTMFIFPHELLPVAAAATRDLRQSLDERWRRDSGISPTEFERLAAAVDEALAAGPATVRELRRRLDVPSAVDLSGIVGRMCDAARVVGGAPPGYWRSSIRRYHRWADVLPELNVATGDPGRAQAKLIRRYMVSYGPVTLADISWWTGLSRRRCRAALDCMQERIEEVAVADWPGPLYRWRPAEGVADPADPVVRALPLLDAYVQGYRDRERFLDPSLHGQVYDGGGNAAATVVHGGRVIGVWQPIERPAPSVRYHLLAPQPHRIVTETEAELEAAGLLYFDQPVDVIAIPTMAPLRSGGGRSAAHPLDGRVHRAPRRRT